MVFMALKCTFGGKKTSHIRKKNFHVCYTWYKSLIKVFVNEERVSTAFGSNNDTSIVIAFDYHDQSILKIEEYGHSTIQFNSFEVVKCYN